MRRAVFLDRDGVLNRTRVEAGVPSPPRTLDQVEILPGVPVALRRLADAGFLRIVTTNQPDVARGRQRREQVEALNEQLGRALPLDAIYTCYHDDRDDCGCRKPKPGLLLAAAARHGVDLSQSFMVGDRWRDVAAGQAAGCRSLLIRQSYSEAERCNPDGEAVDLLDAVERILAVALLLPAPR